jgi:hypothetical protein
LSVCSVNHNNALQKERIGNFVVVLLVNTFFWTLVMLDVFVGVSIRSKANMRMI